MCRWFTSTTIQCTASSPAPTFDQQLACADGTSPDPSTGLCADGSQPQPFNATASSPAPTFDQQLACADGTSPDPSTGLCADGSQPQPFNATASSPAPTSEQQLSVLTVPHLIHLLVYVLMVHNHNHSLDR